MNGQMDEWMKENLVMWVSDPGLGLCIAYMTQVNSEQHLLQAKYSHFTVNCGAHWKLPKSLLHSKGFMLEIAIPEDWKKQLVLQNDFE